MFLQQLLQQQKPMRKSDTSEKILINGLSLLKMLKHGKQGIPLEVMGIMLGQKIDEYAIEIFDVFATPQVATGQNVETTDEKYMLTYMKLLERTGYSNLVYVGWYHSHPGFDVWLSGVDYENQKNMEQLDDRAVAVVVDPVLSVRGKVVIGAFRNIPINPLKESKEDPREKTSFIGHTCNPSPTTIYHDLNKRFYQMPIEFKMNPSELHMLSSLHRPAWSTGFALPSMANNDAKCLEILKNLTQCAKTYRRSILDEANMKSQEEIELAHVGKVDPKQYMRQTSEQLANSQASLMAALHVTNEAF